MLHMYDGILFTYCEGKYLILLFFFFFLVFSGILEEDSDCLLGQNFIEVIDSYSDSNDTVWRLCPGMLGSQLSVDSYLNTLKVRTVYGDTPSYIKLNVTLTVKPG